MASLVGLSMNFMPPIEHLSSDWKHILTSVRLGASTNTSNRELYRLVTSMLNLFHA